MIDIRSARSDDAKSIVEIYYEVHPAPRDDHPFEHLAVVVAELAGFIVGYSSAHMLPDKTWLLCETLVRREFQQLGIGRALMVKRLRLGEQLCAVEAIGGVDPDHESMKHLLVTQGFEPDPSVPQQFLGAGRIGYSKGLGGWA